MRRGGRENRHGFFKVRLQQEEPPLIAAVIGVKLFDAFTISLLQIFLGARHPQSQRGDRSRRILPSPGRHFAKWQVVP